MSNFAKLFTEYILNKGMITEEECQEYEYGFTVAMEKGLSLFISFIIAILMNTIVEAILFFVIFIPLRKYAGGLHLERYASCLILSCLTFLGVMFISKYLFIDELIGLSLIIGIDLLIAAMYPVENINRAVDEEENHYFKKKLKKHLTNNIIIAVMCVVLKNKNYIALIVATLFMVLCTMVIGKLKYNRQKELHSI